MESVAREALERRRLANGRFGGAPPLTEAQVDVLVAVNESMHHDLERELKRIGAVTDQVRTILDEVHRRHDKQVTDLMTRSGTSRRVVDDLAGIGYSAAGNVRVRPDGDDPHVTLPPTLVDETTSVLLKWRFRDKTYASPRFLGARLRLQGRRVCDTVRRDGLVSNRAQLDAVNALERALEESENTDPDNHEFYDEQVASALSAFAARP